eukprot:Polyplicarium_translucidae@DN732_c0_g1_i1.p1
MSAEPTSPARIPSRTMKRTISKVHHRAWPHPLVITKPPGPFTFPEELVAFEPAPEAARKFFFKGTAKEVAIRQIFNHVPLSEEEQRWLRDWRKKCEKLHFETPHEAEAFLIRVLYFNKRKFKDQYLEKSYEHLQLQISWRLQYFPLSDSDPELAADLAEGIMYWGARDSALRPLLVLRLKRLPKGVSPERFKRLTVFCFEYAVRYLFLPGRVETCSALLDVRGVPLHSFPVSALTDMTSTLTKQFPFRLDRMYIINDSIFIQTVWSVAKQFLTEVQQQKMNFFRTGFQEALLRDFAVHQLERSFGGSREELKVFYPFPLPPGPFEAGFAGGPNPQAHQYCHEAVDAITQEGGCWEGDKRPPINWAPGAARIFAALGLPPPENSRQTFVPPVVQPPTKKRTLSDLAGNSSPARQLNPVPLPAPQFVDDDDGLPMPPPPVAPPPTDPGSPRSDVPAVLVQTSRAASTGGSLESHEVAPSSSGKGSVRLQMECSQSIVISSEQVAAEPVKPTKSMILGALSGLRRARTKSAASSEKEPDAVPITDRTPIVPLCLTEVSEDCLAPSAASSGPSRLPVPPPPYSPRRRRGESFGVERKNVCGPCCVIM